MIDESNFSEQSLAGQLLVADASLLESQFHQSVVLMTAHETGKGAMGVIINKPVGQTLGELRPEFNESSLNDLPVFHGGPVRSEEILLAAWCWDLKNRSFRLYFGLSAERLLELKAENKDLVCRAFLGYAGWDGNQLENEIANDNWTLEVFGFKYKDVATIQLWQKIVSEGQIDESWFSDLPNDPSLN